MEPGPLLFVGGFDCRTRTVSAGPSSASQPFRSRRRRRPEPKATGPSESPPTSATQPPQRTSNVNQAPLLCRIVPLGWGLSTAMLCRWSNRSFTTPARIRRLFGSNSCREVTRLSAGQFGRSTEAHVPWSRFSAEANSRVSAARSRLPTRCRSDHRSRLRPGDRRHVPADRDLSQERRYGRTQPTRLRRGRTVR